MPVGALIGLKKMITSPFGPAILIAIPLVSLIAFQYLEIKSLKKDNATHMTNAASLKVAKDVCENESKGLRSRLNKLTSDLKLMEMRYDEAQLKAKNSASEEMEKAVVRAEKEIKEVKTSEEMTSWYQEAFK